MPTHDSHQLHPHMAYVHGLNLEGLTEEQNVRRHAQDHQSLSRLHSYDDLSVPKHLGIEGALASADVRGWTLLFNYIDWVDNRDGIAAMIESVLARRAEPQFIEDLPVQLTAVAEIIIDPTGECVKRRTGRSKPVQRGTSPATNPRLPQPADVRDTPLAIQVVSSYLCSLLKGNVDGGYAVMSDDARVINADVIKTPIEITIGDS